MSSISPHVTLQDLLTQCPKLLTPHRADPSFTLQRLHAAKGAAKQDLIFVSSKIHLQEAAQSSALTWVVSKDLVDQVPDSVPHVLVSSNVQLAMAQIGKLFFPQRDHFIPIGNEPIHPSAQIAATAELGENCIIGPGAVISHGVKIGAHAIIGANAVLETNVIVGDRTHIHPLVFIGHGCVVGNDCEILPNTTIGSEGYGYAQDEKFQHHRLTHYGRVVIEDYVHIGAGVQIDRGTFLDSRIGKGTKIDNHCHFGHNIQIGQNTLITGGMITAGSVTIGSYCIFGGRTTIKGHITICDRARFGGLSAISKSVTKPGEYGGHPLQEIAHDMRIRATLKTLPDMSKQLKRVLKHLGMGSGDS